MEVSLVLTVIIYSLHFFRLIFFIPLRIIRKIFIIKIFGSNEGACGEKNWCSVIFPALRLLPTIYQPHCDLLKSIFICFWRWIISRVWIRRRKHAFKLPFSCSLDILEFGYGSKSFTNITIKHHLFAKLPPMKSYEPEKLQFIFFLFRKFLFISDSNN